MLRLIFFILFAFFIFPNLSLGQEKNSVLFDLKYNDANTMLTITSSYPPIFTYLRPTIMPVVQSGPKICQFRTDYNHDGMANSFDYLLCLLGKVDINPNPQTKSENNQTITQKTKYVLLFYPKNTQAPRQNLQDGGQFLEPPTEGNYLAADLDLDTNLSTDFLLFGDDPNTAQFINSDKRSGLYIAEIIIYYQNHYETVQKEIELK